MRQLFILTSLLLGHQILVASEPMSPQEIIEKAIDARGGKAQIQRYALVHLIGEGTVFDGSESTTSKIERWSGYPLKQKTVLTQTISGRKSTTIIVLDENRAWMKCDEAQTETLEGADLDILKDQACQHLLLYPLIEEKQTRLSLKGEIAVDGEPCWRILVQRKNRADTTLAFSKKTFLPRARTFVNAQVTTEVVYSDYQKLDNCYVAHKQETFVNSRLISRFRLLKAEPIKELDEKLFAKP